MLKRCYLYSNILTHIHCILFTQVLGNFIARAVADDCLPPAYVTKNGVSSSAAR